MADSQTIRSETTATTTLSAVSVLNELLIHALEECASDIHIDPNADEIHIRLRVDGHLLSGYSLSLDLHLEIIARLKIMAGLRTDEHFMPQDGRFTFETGGTFIDVRISIARSHHGENAVLRLLVGESESHSLPAIGISDADLEKIMETIDRNEGMILVTGPTGSGKTTTLYALLQEIIQLPVSVVTIEDPIEYGISGARQFQVHHHSHFTFATGLRAILRQDPDVIMVGEIRDAETAVMALNAAQTGHLVLSTIHAGSAAGAIERLSGLGATMQSIASTLAVIITQRLVRKICEECKVVSLPKSESLEKLAVAGIISENDRLLEFCTGTGCDSCGGTGYKGRIGVFHCVSPSQLSAEKSQQNTKTSSLASAAFDACRQGVTTVEEVVRVSHI